MANLYDTYKSSLQPASFNGVSFGVSSMDYQTGRRVAVHDYPFFDSIFCEDMGLGIRKVRFTGWLIGTDSSDVISQGNAMQKAVETKGTGTLIHPRLGTFSANCITASFTDQVDKGNCISVAFEFIITSSNTSSTIAPFSSTDTTATSNMASDELDDSSSFDFNNDINTTPSLAAFVSQAATNAVSGFSDLITPFTTDASTIIHAADGINFLFDSTYNLGRYTAGNLLGVPSAIANLLNSGLPPKALLQAGTTALLQADAVARQGVLNAAQAAVQASSAQASGMPAAIQGLVESLRAAASPSDGVRIISTLANYAPQTISTGTGIISAAIANNTDTIAALCRRAALSSLGRACASYSPSSATDAATVLGSVLPLFDSEIANASASNDSDSLAALKKLKHAITDDMNNKATGLQSILIVNPPASIPLLRLAMQYYGDATQAEDILLRNPDIPCSLFCGSSVEILSP